MLKVLAFGLILLYQIQVLFYVFLLYVNILMNPGDVFCFVLFCF